MPNSLRMQEISERITGVHGDLYLLLTHQAAQIEADKIGGQGQAAAGRGGQDLQGGRRPLAAKAPAAQQPKYDKLLKDLKETREALDVIVAMISADFASAAGFAAPFEDQYAKMSANLETIVAATQAETNRQAAASAERAPRRPRR